MQQHGLGRAVALGSNIPALFSVGVQRADPTWGPLPPGPSDALAVLHRRLPSSRRSPGRGEGPRSPAAAPEYERIAIGHQTRRQGRPFTLMLTKTENLFTREKAARRRAETDLAWLTSGRGPAG